MPNEGSLSPDDEQPAEPREREISIEEVLSEVRKLDYSGTGDINILGDFESSDSCSLPFGPSPGPDTIMGSHNNGVMMI